MKRQAKTRVVLAVISILVGGGFSFSSLADDSERWSPPRGDPPSPQVVKNEIVVIIKSELFSHEQDFLKKTSQLKNVGNRLAKDLSKAFQTEDNSVEVIALYPALGILSLRLPQNVSMQSAIDYLKLDGQVESVSLNYKGTLHGHHTPPPPPNDFYWTHDWSAGSPYAGLAYLWGLDKIGMKQAWGLLPQWGTPPGSLPIVAVVDTGIDYAHPELNNHMWTNPGETLNDGIDNDGNGFVDDFNGVNIVYERSTAFGLPNDCTNAQWKIPLDIDGHGTEVAGTIAANGNNQSPDVRSWTVGVTQTVKLMAVKITCKHPGDDLELPYLDDALAGIEYAVRMGASVIIGPWGFEVPRPNSTVDRLKAAIQSGESTALYVASAGNGDRDIDTCSVSMWPQRFGLQNLIVVAATGPSDERWASTTPHGPCDTNYFGSNYGVSSVDIGAPGAGATFFSVANAPVGVAVFEVAVYGGTSAAAPHVAGCAALLQTILSMTPKDLKTHLIKTGEPKSLPIKPFDGSTRRLDCGRAVDKLLPLKSLVDTTPPFPPASLNIR